MNLNLHTKDRTVESFIENSIAHHGFAKVNIRDGILLVEAHRMVGQSAFLTFEWNGVRITEDKAKHLIRTRFMAVVQSQHVAEEHGYYDEDELEWRNSEFADPYGKSALRAASKRNPRNLPCPTCKQPNRLTPKDKALGYQCDSCADNDEMGGW